MPALAGMKKSMSLGAGFPAAYSFFAGSEIEQRQIRLTNPALRALLSADADGSFVNRPRKTNATFGGACFAMHIENAPVTRLKISFGLDYIVAPRFVWADQVGESDIVQIIIDQLVKTSPHRQCAAAVHAVAGNALRGFQTGYGGQ